MTFGDKIREARESHHLTQAEVATQLHVSRKTVSSWETGRSYPDIGMLVKLSDTYKLSLDQLLRRDPNMINHYENQNTLSKRSELISHISYYLNIVLLFITIINRLKPMPFGIHYLSVVWFLNVIILMGFVDYHNFFQRKANRILFIACAIVITIAVLFLNAPVLAKNPAYAAGQAFGSLTISFFYVISFLFILADHSIAGNKQR
ncbi:helix-turn-helix transcriptional regulator [Lentilactobacillus parafarraginis]|jgi:transcriptional regulator with XRE-family HTH domain|uniref:DNA-binding helix-turn-helix protein n=2 Tax=Lentilactobacillus parafarraginis TaxID=390842 RepID=A0A0R1YL47_9LACO|nr:helix-turn-helix transcriptional regulator [Lentilactobacillus parafarraginis]KRM43278.1 DNA-binding helix-turn-helix protein [Lentilactobacillus parafarraginis DSM 18390 = JCM 14109]TLQ19331.1 helix-turn-helix transcriptional regulator [Lentilactobacillus parafarraginis]